MNIKINENYDNLKESYLFSETARRINKYTAEHPDKKVIKLSIGAVSYTHLIILTERSVVRQYNRFLSFIKIRITGIFLF